MCAVGLAGWLIVLHHRGTHATRPTQNGTTERNDTVLVRYIVTDVDAALDFYTRFGSSN
jgi:hypothetical protein